MWFLTGMRSIYRLQARITDAASGATSHLGQKVLPQGDGIVVLGIVGTVNERDSTTSRGRYDRFPGAPMRLELAEVLRAKP